MREIKFRAWDKSYKRIIEVAGINFYDGVMYSNFDKYGDGLEDPNVLANVVLMQYTGLKDRNGKEIFEGDIVKLHGAFAESIPPEEYVYDIAGVVKFGDCHFYVQDVEVDSGRIELNRYPSITEVIGNIYESPELLDGEGA